MYYRVQRDNVTTGYSWVMLLPGTAGNSRVMLLTGTAGHVCTTGYSRVMLIPGMFSQAGNVTTRYVCTIGHSRVMLQLGIHVHHVELVQTDTTRQYKIF